MDSFDNALESYERTRDQLASRARWSIIALGVLAAGNGILSAVLLLHEKGVDVLVFPTELIDPGIGGQARLPYAKWPAPYRYQAIFMSFVTFVSFGCAMWHGHNLRRAFDCKFGPALSPKAGLTDEFDSAMKRAQAAAGMDKEDIDTRFSLDSQSPAIGANGKTIRLLVTLEMVQWVTKHPDELQGILLHELAHSANDDIGDYQDSEARLLALGRIFVPAFLGAFFLSWACIRLTSGEMPEVKVGGIGFVVLLTILGSVATNQKLLRQSELLADHRVAAWGYGASLCSALRLLGSRSRTRFLSLRAVLHPSVKLRIKRLETFREPTNQDAGYIARLFKMKRSRQ
jgi:hypothetical protein